jgi:hypothetical protein
VVLTNHRVVLPGGWVGLRWRDASCQSVVGRVVCRYSYRHTTFEDYFKDRRSCVRCMNKRESRPAYYWPACAKLKIYSFFQNIKYIRSSGLPCSFTIINPPPVSTCLNRRADRGLSTFDLIAALADCMRVPPACAPLESLKSN